MTKAREPFREVASLQLARKAGALLLARTPSGGVLPQLTCQASALLLAMTGGRLWLKQTLRFGVKVVNDEVGCKVY
jgi:hypothetical protein